MITYSLVAPSVLSKVPTNSNKEVEQETADKLMVNDEEETKEEKKPQLRLPPKSSSVVRQAVSVIQKPETAQQRPVKVTQLSVVATTVPVNEAGTVLSDGREVGLTIWWKQFEAASDDRAEKDLAHLSHQYQHQQRERQKRQHG
eukprot:TRINITY_DN9594_c0_g1_i8.p3 TRINITY_DN9594_c0_g1~~TRINITY_DN9594_c0_g1_i8.p3  ORF type:complete len:144 (-),score=32.93 TRINITY_DN9594_c0_g1_i8:352-783(-)